MSGTRKRFTPEHLKILEKTFASNTHPDPQTLRDVSKTLTSMGATQGLEQVKNWFTNRRQKQKRLDAREAAGEKQAAQPSPVTPNHLGAAMMLTQIQGVGGETPDPDAPSAADADQLDGSRTPIPGEGNGNSNGNGSAKKKPAGGEKKGAGVSLASAISATVGATKSLASGLFGIKPVTIESSSDESSSSSDGDFDILGGAKTVQQDTKKRGRPGSKGNQQPQQPALRTASNRPTTPTGPSAKKSKLDALEQELSSVDQTLTTQAQYRPRARAPDPRIRQLKQNVQTTQARVTAAAAAAESEADAAFRTQQAQRDAQHREMQLYQQQQMMMQQQQQYGNPAAYPGAGGVVPYHPQPGGYGNPNAMHQGLYAAPPQPMHAPPRVQSVPSRAADSGTGNTPGAAPIIHLKVQHADGSQHGYSLRRVHPFNKLFDAHLKEHDLPPTTKFMFEGQVVNPSATPASLDMQEDDIIECMARTSAAPMRAVMLRLREQNGEVHNFQLPIKRPLNIVLQAYCEKTKRDPLNIKLKFDGEALDLNRPPSAYDMEDEDLIEVVFRSK